MIATKLYDFSHTLVYLDNTYPKDIVWNIPQDKLVELKKGDESDEVVIHGAYR